MGNKRKRPHADIQLIIDMYDVLMSYANYYTRSEKHSYDIVQRLFERLLIMQKKEGNLHRIMYNGTPNRVYLFNAIRNSFLNDERQKKNYRSACETLDYFNEEPPRIALRDEIYQKAKESVETIPNNERGYYTKLFIEYFDNQKSLRQISEGSNISLKTVFNSVRHLKQHIHKNVKSLYNDRH